MTSEPAPTLNYSTDGAGNRDIFWRVFRLGMIIWPAVVLLRHAAYWLSVATQQTGFRISFPSGALAFAAIEAVLLTLLLITALRARHPSRMRVAAMGRICAAFILAVLVNMAIERAPFLVGAQSLDPVREAWLIVSRLQTLVVPTLAVAAFAWWGREATND